RIAMTSACAVGSWAAVTRLTPSMTRPPGRTITAPNGPPPAATLAVARSTARWRGSDSARERMLCDPSLTRRSCAGRRGSRPRARRARLADRALGVQLGGDVGPADDVHPRGTSPAGGGHLLGQFVDAHLPGADHDGVHRQHPLLPFLEDVQALLVDVAVGHAAVLDHAGVAQLRTVHPSGGAAESGADPGLL